MTVENEVALSEKKGPCLPKTLDYEKSWYLSPEIADYIGLINQEF